MKFKILSSLFFFILSFIFHSHFPFIFSLQFPHFLINKICKILISLTLTKPKNSKQKLEIKQVWDRWREEEIWWRWTRERGSGWSRTASSHGNCEWRRKRCSKIKSVNEEAYVEMEAAKTSSKHKPWKLLTG